MVQSFRKFLIIHDDPLKFGTIAVSYLLNIINGSDHDVRSKDHHKPKNEKNTADVLTFCAL